MNKPENISNQFSDLSASQPSIGSSYWHLRSDSKALLLEVGKNLIISIFLLSSLIISCNPFADKYPNWNPPPIPNPTQWADDVNPDNVWQHYPRPQMVRETWLNLNGLWDYAIRPKDEEEPDTMDGKILVPFPVESSLSGVGEKVGKENQIWYRRMIKIPEEWTGKRMILKFEASDWQTKIWLNDEYLVTWKGGYDTFGVDITKRVEAGGEYELVVAVWDPTESGDQPRGKQAENPSGIFHTSATGIWQTAWIEALPHTAMGRFVSIPDIDNGKMTIIPYVMAPMEDDRVLAIVRKGEEEIARARGLYDDTLRLDIPNPRLWSTDDPFLYDLELQVRRDGQTIDKVLGYVGMRKISLGKDENGITRIMLNNEFVFQNGVLDQGYWPDGLYLPPTEEAMIADIKMAKKLGFNMIRKHLKIEPNRYYYWCDKIGILVWQDVPNSDKTIRLEDVDLNRDMGSFFQFQLELRKMIAARINHPSIVMWVAFNEGMGQFHTKGVVDMIREQDPTRLVNAASGRNDRGVGDVLDIHHFPEPIAPKIQEDRAIVLGKYGGLAEEDLNEHFSDYMNRLKQLSEESGLSSAVYMQLMDVEDEKNGLMTYDREKVKVSPLP